AFPGEARRRDPMNVPLNAKPWSPVMARQRTIKPDFPNWPGLHGVGRDARLLFIYLMLEVDDAGRFQMDRESLLEKYFPHDHDAEMCLALWLGELERESTIEFYRVGDVEFLRIASWRRLQVIDRPTASRLPPSPSEPPAREPRETREESP